MHSRFHSPTRRLQGIGLTVVCLFGGTAVGSAAPTWRASQTLSFSGGPGALSGDLVATGNGAAAVYARQVGGAMHLGFFRLGPDAQTLIDQVYDLSPWPCYQPAVAFDGAGFGVAVSGFTQAFFLRLSATGDVLAGPVQLPGLPSGAEAGRTAGFRVFWTGHRFAVFGLWLEREFPWQELGQGHFHTHLRYWLVDPTGAVEVQRTLRRLAPMTYPGVEGAERDYYDVAPLPDGFFVASYSESAAGPPLSVYYRRFDLAGNPTREEQPLFAAQTAQGPRLAWNGATVAATAVRIVSLPHPEAGNHLYRRCFAPDGTPRGPEVAYGSRLGFGPVVFWTGMRFMTAFCVLHDWDRLGYALILEPFDDTGSSLGPEGPLRDAQGRAVLGRMAFGVDLKFVGSGNVLYAKAQTSDAFAIQISPLWFTLVNDVLTPPPLRIFREGGEVALRWPGDAAPFGLESAVDPARGPWSAVESPPVFRLDHFELRQPAADTRFFRLQSLP
ncbi:MAG: hypothetical protein KF833_17610 [Verrucomicrobiae bacterium]|nr:hypothetical protein [Verrucomicrobiae bacterium]